MASNLYEALEVRKDAPAEQIRKAYKKKALQTHPDKLPQGLSEEEKKTAGDKFREIGHAYEILSDPEKRKEYDIHGVWPPPQPEENTFGAFFDDTFPSRQRGQRSRTFPSPFMRHPHHSYSNFVFMDPFELFNALFQDMDSMFSPSPHTFTPFDPFGNMHAHRSQSLLSNSFFPPFMSTFALDPFGPGTTSRWSPRGGASSESFVSTTVNGVTQTVHTKRDQDGNEHVTRTYPDGREVYSINGVGQPARGHLPENTQEPTVLLEDRYVEPNQPRRQRRNNSQSYILSQPAQTQSRYTFGDNAHDIPTSGHRRYPAPTSQRRGYDVLPPTYSESSNAHREDHHRSYHRSLGTEGPISYGRPERRAADRYPQTAHMSRLRDDDRHNRNWLYQSSRHT